MPIQAIRTGDIFHTDKLNPGEELRGPQIIFGINTVGTNQDGKSVAYQVGRRFCKEFQSITSPYLEIGYVYSMQGSLDVTTPTRFHGIVCNDKLPSGKHDWSFADLGVREGLAELSKGRIIMPGQIETRMQSVRTEVLDLVQNAGDFSFDELAKLVKQTESEIHPPLRMAFIGTGPSGTSNRADWRGILQEMNDSSLNLILYLWNKEVHEQVAAVVRQFPALRASRPLSEIEEIYGVAA